MVLSTYPTFEDIFLSLSVPGVKIIFRVGLVLLKCMLGSREKLKACQGQYETMELLRALEPRSMQEGFLAREVGPPPNTTFTHHRWLRDLNHG